MEARRKCGQCYHYPACASWNSGYLYNTDASNCINFASIKTTAYWEWNPNGHDWGLGAWVCSNCKVKNDNISCDENTNPYRWAGSRYCPNCGKAMYPIQHDSVEGD